MGLVGVTNGTVADQPLFDEQQLQQSLADPLTLYLKLALQLATFTFTSVYLRGCLPFSCANNQEIIVLNCYKYDFLEIETESIKPVALKRVRFLLMQSMMVRSDQMRQFFRQEEHLQAIAEVWLWLL